MQPCGISTRRQKLRANSNELHAPSQKNNEKNNGDDRVKKCGNVCDGVHVLPVGVGRLCNLPRSGNKKTVHTTFFLIGEAYGLFVRFKPESEEFRFFITCKLNNAWIMPNPGGDL